MKRYSDAWVLRRDANEAMLHSADVEVRPEDWWRFYHLITAQAMGEISTRRWREIVMHALSELPAAADVNRLKGPRP